MNPETAHKVTLWGLRLAEKMRVLPLVMGEVPSDPVEILGMKFPNRVGLAAGMDKEAFLSSRERGTYQNPLYYLQDWRELMEDLGD